MANNLQPVNIFPPPSSSDDETEDQDGSSTITTDDEQGQHPPQPQEPQDFWSLYPRLCASLESEELLGYLTLWPGESKEYVKKTISGMREGKARKLEDALEDLSVKRQQLDAMRTRVINKQAEYVSGLNIFNHGAVADVEESGINGQQVNEALVDDDAAEAGIVET